MNPHQAKSPALSAEQVELDWYNSHVASQLCLNVPKTHVLKSA